MIIRSVHLVNIRSYVDEDIHLGEGITLFEGDIGSGKTTLLMAIDFALFGNSTKDFYERLLRKGATSGYVEVVFEHEGGIYTIHRALEKRGDRITNTESYVITPEGKIKLTATQVRNYVLKLMGVDVEKSRRKSLPVVKYAIYTPQETMKEILEGKDEERLDVIRGIFKLDEYKEAAENAGEVSKNLRADAQSSRLREEEIGRIREEIERKEGEIKDLEEDLGNLKKDISVAEKVLEEKKAEWERIQDMRNRYEKLKVEKGSLEARIRTVQESLEKERKELEEITKMKGRIVEIEKDAQRYQDVLKRQEDLQRRFRVLKDEEVRYRSTLERIKVLEKRVEELESIKMKLEKLLNFEKNLKEQVSDLDTLESRRKELEEKRSSVRGKIHALLAKIDELNSEMEEIKSLEGVCPKCKRPLSEEHKKKLLSETVAEIEKIKKDLAQMARKEAELKRSIRETEHKIEELRKVQSELARVEQDIKNMREKVEEAQLAKNELEDMRNKLPKFNEDELKRISIELDSISRDVESLRKIWSEYTALSKGVEREDAVEKRINAYVKTLQSLENKLANTVKNIEKINYDEELYRRIAEEYHKAGETLSSLKSQWNEKNRRLDKLRHEVDEKRRTIEQLQRDVELFRKRGEFGEWLRGEFVETLKEIENLRLLSINEEFRALFEEWFYELLGESEFEAWIDEKFRPIIRYQKFDMPLNTLSGGERTSVALAYRLALNTIVKRSLGLRSNLLILDEPTDGFSKDQLYKLKDVFEKMETSQVIIVSHEKELMNLADVVYHVEKRNGTSRIRKVSG